MIEGKVSVIMAVHNCQAYIQEAIDSIVNQTYSNWELIVCDDASTDQTLHIVEQYKSRFPDRIRILRNDSNKKLAYCLNRCLGEADGEYIARMDGDDISLPTRFEEQIAFLNQYHDVDLVGTAMQRFDEDGLADVITPIEAPDKFCMRNGPPFCHATIMTYKRVYEQLGGYTVAKRTERGQDYDLWFRFFYNNLCGRNLSRVLYLVRENREAIRRRTIKVRYNAFKTTVYGYNLLGFPKKWLVSAAIGSLKRAIVPYPIVRIYRKRQKKKYLMNHKQPFDN